MEIVSRLNKKERHHSDIEIYPYLRDHHLEGKIILPAVESLIIMAREIKTHYSQIELNCLRKASFQRFLSIAPDASQRVFVDMERSDDGGITASLLTLFKSKSGNISREIEHAHVNFITVDPPKLPAAPFCAINKLKENRITVPSAAVYRELVPFGAAYQNIVSDLFVSPEGAQAFISGGNNEANEDLLGSPFPFDAVMHMACVWGQRYAGIVSFPVGFEKRVIHLKTKKQEEYLGCVVPVSITRESLEYNAWIYKDDIMYESIGGIKMMDVTKGRMRPPEWIRI